MSLELSGCFFRVGKENIVFEDLPEEEQDKIISSYNDEKKKRLIQILIEGFMNFDGLYGEATQSEIINGYSEQYKTQLIKDLAKALKELGAVETTE